MPAPIEIKNVKLEFRARDMTIEGEYCTMDFVYPPHQFFNSEEVVIRQTKFHKWSMCTLIDGKRTATNASKWDKCPFDMYATVEICPTSTNPLIARSIILTGGHLSTLITSSQNSKGENLQN